MTDGPVAALIVATLLLSLRLVLMGATLRRALAGLSTARALVVAWFVTDENWALTNWMSPPSIFMCAKFAAVIGGVVRRSAM